MCPHILSRHQLDDLLYASKKKKIEAEKNALQHSYHETYSELQKLMSIELDETSSISHSVSNVRKDHLVW